MKPQRVAEPASLFVPSLPGEEGKRGRMFRHRSKGAEQRAVAQRPRISTAALRGSPAEAVFEDARQAVVFEWATGEVAPRQPLKFAEWSPDAPGEARLRLAAAR